MAAGEKLFEQTLKEDIDPVDRIAVGIEGQKGASNILPADFFGNFFQFGRNIILGAGSQVVEFDKEQKSSDYAIFIRSYDGVGYEIISQTTTDFTIECLEETRIDYLTILF